MRPGKNFLIIVSIMLVILCMIGVLGKLWISRGENISVKQFSMWVYMIYMILPAVMICGGVLAGCWRLSIVPGVCIGLLLSVVEIAMLAFVFSVESLHGRSGQPIYIKYMCLLVGLYLVSFGLTKFIIWRKG